MEKFILSTELLMGNDALDKLAIKFNKIFIVTDEMMAQNGMISYVTNTLERHNIVWQCYSKIKADPDVEMLLEGVETLAKFAPDAVLAFGGGSPIDAAKAIVFFAKNQLNLKDCKFIAIPTTSGTGTEVSQFAVITDRAKGVKYPMVDECLVPDYAVLDAHLTLSVPPQITADTGIDVLTHAIEAYLSRNANSFTDAMAEKSIKLLAKNLKLAYHEPQNILAREEMLRASCMAGAAFSNAGLGLCHAMAHALGAMAKLPHGRANAILLPYIIEYNSGVKTGAVNECAAKYADISRLLGDDVVGNRQSVLSLVRKIRRLEKELRIPTSLADTGLSTAMFAEILPKMTAAALEDKCLATNPRPVTEAEIIDIYRCAYEGK